MTETAVWTTRGFESFRRGTFGNAGHNLYVSKAGVLQRIYQFDLNGDGYFDLVFCNDHPHHEQPPTYVYTDPLGARTRQEVPSDGARTGAVADLNGDGYDDLVMGMFHNGERFDLNAFVYYGSEEGFTERRHQRLPAPHCLSVAAGDFNGDGRPDLAFVCHRSYDPLQRRLSGRIVRVFYQTELGLEASRFVDVEIAGHELATADLDGDGYDDLIVRNEDGTVDVYWGGAGGLDAGNYTTVPTSGGTTTSTREEQGEGDRVVGGERMAGRFEAHTEESQPLAKVVILDGLRHVFVAHDEAAYLVPANGRQFGTPVVLECGRPMSVAVGDVDGDGYDDVVVACRDTHGAGECSWVYWGGPDGFTDSRKTKLASRNACDVALGDLDGDGFVEVVLCQDRKSDSFSSDSSIYKAAARSFGAPITLDTEDARRTFIAGGWDSPRLILVNQYGRDLSMTTTPVYFGGPDGFSPDRKTDLPCMGSVEAICADFNDDGRPDVFLTNTRSDAETGGGSYLLLNSPNGFPDTPSQVVPTSWAWGACCADFNRDGYLDVIVSAFNVPDLLVFYGCPDGFDTANPHRIRMEHEGVEYQNALYLYTADLNNDGWLDLVVPQIRSERSFVLWGGPEGFSMERSQVLPVHRGASARAADLTGNGFLDLVIGGGAPSPDIPHDSFAYIYWNGPEGLREDRRTLLPAKHVNAMGIADFNGDGTLDLFVGSYDDGRERELDSYLYWNRDRSGFSAADRTRIHAHCMSGCVAADFNEDGRTDLAIAYHKVDGDHVGHSAVWWNGPDGFDERRVTTLPTSGPHGMTSVEPGNIMDRGPEEYSVSSPFELPERASVDSISWHAEVPDKTWVRAQLRYAPSAESLEACVWLGPKGEDTWFENEQLVGLATDGARWVQYRLVLGAINSGRTPRVTQVNVHYEMG